MTVETIEVQIDQHALANRSNGEKEIQKIMQARKNESKFREMHLHCAKLIENDSVSSLIAYLKHPNQADILISDVQDSNGKTLLHECTFGDSFMCLKALLKLAKS